MAAVVGAIGPVLEPIGFCFSKKEEGFVRKLSGGKQVLGVGLKDYRPAYNLSFAMGIKLDPVDAILRPRGASALTLTQLEFLGLPSTMPWGPFWFAGPGAEMDQGFLETGRSQGFWAERPTAMNEAVSDAASLAAEKLAPFFETYRDVDSINRVLHDEPGAPRDSLFSRLFQRKREPEMEPVQTSRRRFDSRRHSDRFMTAIVFAHLARDKRFRKLASRYLNEASLFGDEETRKGSALVESLRPETK